MFIFYFFNFLRDRGRYTSLRYTLYVPMKYNFK